MQNFFWSFILIISPFFPYAQSQTDVLHYRLQIGLNDNNDTIRGQAMIHFRVKAKTTSVVFDLASMAAGKGMQVTKISSGEPGKPILSFLHNHNKLEIKNEFEEGETSMVEIHYSGIPAEGLVISKTKFGRRSFFADNWPDRGHNWFPCHENPADKATVEFIVTTPEKYQVVANGIQVEESSGGNGFKTTHWKEETPISTKVMTIGVAEFAVTLAGVVQDCIPVYSWVFPENREIGFSDYDAAKNILPFYIERVGPYGFKKLANVQSKTMFGGLENANAIFYSERSVTGNRRLEGLMAHEIAHQWFGNMATEKSFAHLWLSEGFATYFTILYLEKKYGTDTATALLQEDRDQVIDYSKNNNSPVVDTAQKNYMKLLNANSYQKGGWVLHMLRRELGDSAFWQSIRKYYQKYAGSIADTEDLKLVFEEVSGKNLELFFKQWLYTPGQPQLAVNWKYHAGEKMIYLTVEQQQQDIFSFPLDLAILSAHSAATVKTIQITRPLETIRIPYPESPSGIRLDPFTSLLFSGNISRKN